MNDYDYDENYVNLEFTPHGRERFAERSKMTEEELNEILRTNKSVLIGTESNRRHELLYSPIDNDYYVIIYDYKVGTVVTFIYNHYHDNIAWKISDDSLMEAKRLAIGEDEETLYVPEDDETDKRSNGSTAPSTVKYKIKTPYEKSGGSVWTSFPAIKITPGATIKEIHDMVFTVSVLKSILDAINEKRPELLTDEKLLIDAEITFTYGKEYVLSMDVYDYLISLN